MAAVYAPLTGIRAVELARSAAFAGKLLASSVPTLSSSSRRAATGHAGTRRSSDDEPGTERSLWWWYYNTSKRSVVLDLDCPMTRRRSVTWSEPPMSSSKGNRRGGSTQSGSMPTACARAARARLGLGHRVGREADAATRVHRSHRARRRWPGLDVRLRRPLVPAGAWRREPEPPHRDLRGGHRHAHRAAVPRPRRPGTARRREHARAANVTTEAGTFYRLVAGETVQRQTGRHAAIVPDDPRGGASGATVDGRTRGFLPRLVGPVPGPPRLARRPRAALRVPDSIFLDIGVCRECIDVVRHPARSRGSPRSSVPRVTASGSSRRISRSTTSSTARRNAASVGASSRPRKRSRTSTSSRGGSCAVRHDDPAATFAIRARRSRFPHHRCA